MICKGGILGGALHFWGILMEISVFPLKFYIWPLVSVFLFQCRIRCLMGDPYVNSTTILFDIDVTALLEYLAATLLHL